MVINLLIMMIFVIAIFLVSAKRIPLLIFIIPASIFQAITDHFSDNLFYVVGCFLDLLVIILLSAQSRVGWISLFLGVVSVVSIAANALGWVMYDKGYSSLLYDGVFTAIYGCVTLVTLLEWWLGVGKNSNHTSLRRYWV